MAVLTVGPDGVGGVILATLVGSIVSESLELYVCHSNVPSPRQQDIVLGPHARSTNGDSGVCIRARCRSPDARLHRGSASGLPRCLSHRHSRPRGYSRCTFNRRHSPRNYKVPTTTSIARISSLPRPSLPHWSRAISTRQDIQRRSRSVNRRDIANRMALPAEAQECSVSLWLRTRHREGGASGEPFFSRMGRSPLSSAA